MKLPDINRREFARMVLRGFGVKQPERFMRTEAEVAATEKRRQAALSGWAKRKEMFKAPPL